MHPHFRALSLGLLLSCAGCSDQGHSRTATAPTRSSGGQTVAPPGSDASTPASAVPTFQGPIVTPEQKQALDQFLSDLGQDSTFALDLALSDEQLGQLGPGDENRLYLDLATAAASPEGGLTGSELLILLADRRHAASAISVSRTPGSGRLAGKFRIVEISGPSQGIMSVAAEPVPGA